MTIRELQQDPKFDKMMERMLETQKQKYFLMLAKSRAKLPQNFDLEFMRQDSESSHTQHKNEQDDKNINWVNSDARGDQGDTTRNHEDTTKKQDETRRDHGYRRTHEDTRRTHVDNPLLTLTQQMQNMQQQIQDIQNGTSSKRYSLEDICPYPFDKILNMIPFPQNCEIPKYDKYDGKTDPQDHTRELCTMSMEFAHNETYAFIS